MKVLLFAQLATIAGCSELDWPLTDPVTGDEFWGRLVERYPGLEPFRAHVRLARDQEYVGWSERLLDGHEVALIPPVSGG